MKKAQLLVLAIACSSSPAFAAEDLTLEIVTVTAERRSEDIKNVPISVSTLSDESLSVLASGGQDVRLLAARVPSLNVESSFGRAFPRFYIRGYGNTDFRLNASQPVSLVYDDVVQENPILKGFPIFDLDQVEVLRGPQGTLFGRNTPGGVVKFDSVKPQSELGGYLTASGATFATINIEGAVNVPLAEGWSARLSGLYQHRDDYVDNALTGRKNAYEGYDDRAARLQVLYENDAGFSALVNAHARNLGGTARLFRANIIRPGSNDLVGGFDDDSVAFDGRNQQQLSIEGGSVRLAWDLGNIALYSITGYETLDTFSRGDIDGGFGCGFCSVPNGPGFVPFASETADGVPDLDQLTQEVRVESQYDGPLNWQAGVYYFDEDYDLESFAYDSLAGGVQTQFLSANQTNQAFALFGSLAYQVSDALGLRAGVRYSNDEKRFTTGQPVGFTFPDPTAPTGADLSDDEVSWDVSGTYTVNDSVNLYARVASGYRASSVQPASAFGNQSIADPETNTSVEVGVKADLLARRATLAFDVYRFEVEDQQLTAVGGGSNAVRLLNADKSVGYGAELDLQAYLTRSLLVTFGLSYNHTEIEDSSLQVATCFSCTVTDPIDPVTGLARIDGNRLPQAPEWITSLTLRYSMPIGSGELFTLLDFSYRSEVNFFLYESTEFTGPSLAETGLRVGYNWGNDKYQVAAFARNLTDEEVVTGGIDFNNLTGFINEPRIFGVQLSVKY